MSQTTTTTASLVTLNAVEPPKETRRCEYKAPEYFIKQTTLKFQLGFEHTKVESELHLYRNAGSPAHKDLELDGADTITLRSIKLQLKDGEAQALSEKQYSCLSNGNLLIQGHLFPVNADEIFKLYISVEINPSTNTELMGLYKAGPILCTQCEAEGFRRITYFLDRPDVMASFNVRLESDKKEFPVLLSNGNLVASGDVADGRHFAEFVDPHLKPSYLFAIVAGDLALKESSFMRATGKPAKLSLWCEPKDEKKLDWAMESLKKAMKWDEVRFGRVYDLDWFNVVAVSFFNMGAMENKSLNVFNTCLLLASRETSTDLDFERIMAVIGHEYFHNWTGNRVTCRDWFQLTLKEGLTVYRDQEFSSDLGSRSVQRIENVAFLRTAQFAEDAGPMSHPIRPESYQAIDNFYTATVYRKGAEVIRMYATILGTEGFRKGTDLYFERHDGCAITCDDFRAAMADANGIDLTQFERWYLQSGTPTVTVEEARYDAGSKTFKLVLSQACGPTAGQPTKKPFHIPVSTGLIGRVSKKDLIPTQILHLTEGHQEFELKNVSEDPVLSIFRDYSAPVKIVSSTTDADYAFLAAYDSDDFNKWEAGQCLLKKAILERANKIASGSDAGAVETSTLKLVLEGLRQAASKYTEMDQSFLAFMLELPAVSSLMGDMRPCDPVALSDARSDVRKWIAEQMKEDFQKMYDGLSKTPDEADCLSKKSVARRRLRNVSLAYLTNKENTKLAFQHYNSADNMNDRLSALTTLANFPCQHTEAALADFLKRADGDELVVDKWFSVQAGANHPGVLDNVKALRKHELFTMVNPNTVRSLVVRFAMNPAQFHRIDGQGYEFLADCLADLDKINGRIAARAATSLISWQMFDEKRQVMMKKQLERLDSLTLSVHCKEIVLKGLAALCLVV